MLQRAMKGLSAECLRLASRMALVLTLTGCASTSSTTPGTVVTPFEGVRVHTAAGRVEIQAFVCLDGGWLEQIACSPGTREHEALVVIETRPSNIHAALLMAGVVPGSPGRWRYEDGIVSAVPPTGDRLDVLVRYERNGRLVEEPIGSWIIGATDERPFPEVTWVFAGSAFAENPEWMEPGEHYVADLTGSIVGLVTFGDEVIGFEQVMADQESVEAMQWQVNTDHVPPIGTPVTLVLTHSLRRH